MLSERGFSYAFRLFDLSHEEVKWAVVLAYRFCFPHSSRCMRLFVPRNNERMITKKKEKKKKKNKEIGSLRNYLRGCLEYYESDLKSVGVWCAHLEN